MLAGSYTIQYGSNPKEENDCCKPGNWNTDILGIHSSSLLPKEDKNRPSSYKPSSELTLKIYERNIDSPVKSACLPK